MDALVCAPGGIICSLGAIGRPVAPCVLCVHMNAKGSFVSDYLSVRKIWLKRFKRPTPSWSLKRFKRFTLFRLFRFKLLEVATL